jgi:hypothetical protein
MAPNPNSKMEVGSGIVLMLVVTLIWNVCPAAVAVNDVNCCIENGFTTPVRSCDSTTASTTGIVVVGGVINETPDERIIGPKSPGDAPNIALVVAEPPTDPDKMWVIADVAAVGGITLYPESPVPSDNVPAPLAAMSNVVVNKLAPVGVEVELTCPDMSHTPNDVPGIGINPPPPVGLGSASKTVRPPPSSAATVNASTFDANPTAIAIATMATLTKLNFFIMLTSIF